MEDPILIRPSILARLALITITGALIFSSSAGAQEQFSVEWKDCRLSVSAQQALFSQVLTQVARQTGIRLKGLEELQGRGSIAFSNVPLRQGLENLLSDFTYVIINEPSCTDGASQATVEVFGREAPAPGDFSSDPTFSSVPTGRAAAKRPRTGMGDAAGNKNKVVKKTTAPDEEEQRLRNALLDSDPDVRTEALDKLAARPGNAALDTLLSAAQSDDPTMRQRGLELLSQSTQADPATVLPAFSEALKDEDPNVQALAVRTLVTQGGSAGIELLRQAFGAADPFVKTLIVESLGSMPDAIPLLQEASTDPDESIRNSASALLEQAISEEDEATAVTSPGDVKTAPSSPPPSVDRTQNPARPPGGS